VTRIIIMAEAVVAGMEGKPKRVQWVLSIGRVGVVISGEECARQHEADHVRGGVCTERGSSLHAAHKAP
jgi:hypothetical protein